MATSPILAALIAGLVSFLSPCVLPLVPPYLVYLAGTSLERFADKEPEPRVKRETVAGGGPVRARLLHRVRGARRQRQRDRLADPRLFRAARDHRRHRHHRHGPALSRRHADRAAASAEAAGGGQAGRPVGRLCDGAGFRLRLDAVHRADPRRYPGGGGVRADGDQGRRPAGGLFARPRHSVHRRGLRDRAVRGISGALPQASCAGSSRRWARCWCSPASRSSPAASTR